MVYVLIYIAALLARGITRGIARGIPYTDQLQPYTLTYYPIPTIYRELLF